MRQFDFYEFVGIVSPGALTLVGLGIVHPELRQLVKEHALSAGDLGVFLILSYVAGHLAQSIGNLIENGWWKLWGGWPSDWPRTGKHKLLSAAQAKALETQVRQRIACAEQVSLTGTTEGEWSGLTRQVYADVRAAGRAERVDVFNGNYGLCRGIVAGLAVLLLVSVAMHWKQWWAEDVLLLALGAAAVYRMHRFGKHYARELFVQFLQLPQERERVTVVRGAGQ